MICSSRTSHHTWPSCTAGSAPTPSPAGTVRRCSAPAFASPCTESITAACHLQDDLWGACHLVASSAAALWLSSVQPLLYKCGDVLQTLTKWPCNAAADADAGAQWRDQHTARQCELDQGPPGRHEVPEPRHPAAHPPEGVPAGCCPDYAICPVFSPSLYPTCHIQICPRRTKLGLNATATVVRLQPTSRT